MEVCVRPIGSPLSGSVGALLNNNAKDGFDDYFETIEEA
jgi:hypothetical protein